MAGVCGLTSYPCLFYKNEQGNTAGDSNRSVIALIGTGRSRSICVFRKFSDLWKHCSSSGSLSPRTRRTENDFIQQNICTTIDSPRKEWSFGRPAWGHSVHSQPRSVQLCRCAARLTVLWRRWWLWLFSRCLLRLACATAKPHSKVKTLPVLIFFTIKLTAKSCNISSPLNCHFKLWLYSLCMSECNECYSYSILLNFLKSKNLKLKNKTKHSEGVAPEQPFTYCWNMGTLFSPWAGFKKIHLFLK